MSAELAPRSLRLLLAEDAEFDALMLLTHLSRAGYHVAHRRVETAVELGIALDEPWDLVVADYHMPDFTAAQALSLVRERDAEVPFIVLSGSLGEDAIVAAMKGGANDYILKGNLARLEGAIERELREAETRRERRRLRDQLVIADRLASIGMLAAGVAHEINNPLAAIICNLEFMTVELDGAESAFERDLAASVREALAATNRLRQIVRDLGMLAHGSESERSPVTAVDVEQVLEVAMRMSWSLVRERATLTRSFAGVAPVLASESRLAQVFLNLLVNAAQAIAPGGASANEIRVTTSHDRASGRVAIEVSDTGSGIAHDAIPDLFEPFYATKPAGVGTGLGLAICHRIVTNLGGTIEVRTAPGSGTTFRVLLPQAQR
jgi:C4-dicarboxylate-specific signal transduction histidine kinase